MDGVSVLSGCVMSVCFSDFDELLDLEDFFDDFLDDFFDDFFIIREYDPSFDAFAVKEMESSRDDVRSMEDDAVVGFVIDRRTNVETTNAALMFLVTIMIVFILLSFLMYN